VLDHLVEMYYRSVGRNCNLLLNANPNPDGRVPEADFQRYVEFGKEIKRRFGKPVATTKGRGRIVELALPGTPEIDHVVIMEDIARGERIRAYKVEALGPDGTWKPLCDGVSVGHKRIQQFAPTAASKVRLVVTARAAEPTIRELAVYAVGG
jgi:alpha-L-fucosidase